MGCVGAGAVGASSGADANADADADAAVRFLPSSLLSQRDEADRLEDGVLPLKDMMMIT